MAHRKIWLTRLLLLLLPVLLVLSPGSIRAAQLRLIYSNDTQGELSGCG